MTKQEIYQKGQYIHNQRFIQAASLMTIELFALEIPEVDRILRKYGIKTVSTGIRLTAPKTYSGKIYEKELHKFRKVSGYKKIWGEL